VHPGRTVVLTRRDVIAAVCLLAILAAHSARSEQGRARRISFSILEDYDKEEDLAEVAKDFAPFRELGITAWRGSFGWDDYEPSRGHYVFRWLTSSPISQVVTACAEFSERTLSRVALHPNTARIFELTR